jgi:DNA-binding GntR family transcriptional regulator
VPLYRQVQEHIQTMLQRDRGAERLRLTDADLAHRFGVSRITVRKAVEKLVDNGLLYRIPKLGTFVRPGMLREKLTLTSFLDPWSDKAGAVKIRVGRFERVKADQEIASRLGVKIGENIVYIQRLRFQRNALVVVDDRYMRVEHAKTLTEGDVLNSSFVDYFQNQLDLPIENGELEIEARGATQKEAKAFGIKAGQPVLVRGIVLYGRRKNPLLAGVSVYRADRVSYRVMMSKEAEGGAVSPKCIPRLINHTRVVAR